MKTPKSVVHWTLQCLHWAVAATMVYLAFPTLIDWWGITWIVVTGVILGVILIPVPIWYRLTRGKWPAVYLVIAGFGTGCIGTIFLSLVFLSFPIAHRIVEGTWPWSYLIAQGTLLVVGTAAELYEKHVYKKKDDGEAQTADIV